MILITGAKGVVGQPLIKRLATSSSAYKSVSRSDGAHVKWDMSTQDVSDIAEQLSGCEQLIHCAPIWVLPTHLTALAELGVRRIVVFSSTSVISKQDSSDSTEQGLVKQLSDSERSLRKTSEQSGVDLTILRPSMIYGYGLDQNVMKIANFVGKFGVMALAGRGQGLRQPVHSDDLVAAALSSLDEPQAVGNVYNLAGAETITYRKMVERIFIGLNKRVVIVSIPVPIYRLGLRMAALLTGFSFTSEMANRMNEDLNYDSSAAITDIGYQPQRFLEFPERDLVREDFT